MRVEIYADVLCPWCFIAKRRVSSALTQLADGSGVEVVWRSYELGPNLSRIPGPTAEEEMRDGSWWGGEAGARISRIRDLGAADGVELNLHLARPVNTFDAHRLVHLAADHGRADEVMEGVLYAYHSEGRNVADPTVLERVGVEAGLDARDVRDLLAGEAYADDVRADERRAVDQGVAGVPTLVIDGRPPVPGVQPVQDLRKLLDHAPERDHS